MNEFFDAMDAGSYDWILISVVGIGVVISCFAGRATGRRRARRFYLKQAEAQVLWETRGPDHHATQLAVMNALAAWQDWQHRSPQDLNPDNPGNNRADWDAISLLASLPQEDAGPKLVM